MIETFYVLRSGDKYIVEQDTPGVTTNDVNHALKFKTADKAQNYIKNCMSSKLSAQSWEVIPVTKEVEEGEAKVISPSCETLSRIISSSVVQDDTYSVSSILREFAIKLYKIVDSKEQLNSYLSMCDKRLVDVYHYVEFNTLSDEKSSNVVKLLRNILSQRRTLKDELGVISSIEKSGLIESLYEVTALLSQLDNRTYTPREFDQLFEDTTEE